MSRILSSGVGLALLLIGLVGCIPATSSPPATADNGSAAPSAADVNIGQPLYPPVEPKANETPVARSVDPIVIPNCRFTIPEKVELPSRREGVLLFIATDVEPAEYQELVENKQWPNQERYFVVREAVRKEDKERLETLYPGLIHTRRNVVGKDLQGQDVVQELYYFDRPYRRLREGDMVREGQLLARLDDSLSRDDVAIKYARLEASKADFVAAEKTRDEAKKRYETQVHLWNKGQGTTSQEEMRGAELTWIRYIYEAIAKQQAIKLSESELRQSQTVLKEHEIRSKIDGIIKMIYRRPGEAVKAMEPVFHIVNCDRLRLEGQVELQYLHRLRLGMPVQVEASQYESPLLELGGHMGEITSVAVSNGPEQLIVSASMDKTVRVWDRSKWKEQRIFDHPAPVRAVVCTPKGAEANLCLTGADDGKARLFDLDSDSNEPLRVLDENHAGAINCVAFSPNGQWCATGGDDRAIRLFDVRTGKMVYQFPQGHRGAVTSIQFTPACKLVSTGRDNTIRVWDLGDKGAKLTLTIDDRSGDITSLRVSTDGQRVLFDQGRTLRVLSLPGGQTEGELKATNSTNPFNTFAEFSPDAQLIMTAGASEGKVQLWRTPGPNTRGFEVRQMIPQDASPATCGTFAPDGTFAVTGTRSHRVLVWHVPTAEQLEQRMTATLTLIEQSVDSGARQCRIWAELPNGGNHLIPGNTATIVLKQ
ncbi:MAG: efflux RND transporter periplasmic adaptor subunit [Gemmataceae bacterium]